jgi:hypothetical protein
MATTTAHHPPSGQHRDFKGMERLRLRAARMFEQGTSQAEVANQLGTSRQNAHRWYRKWQQGGRDALRAAGRAGRRPKLDAALAASLSRRCCRARWRTGLTATCGPASGWWWCCNASAGCAIILRTSGASCGRWAGPCSGPSAAPSNATRPRSLAGSRPTGPGSTKNARRRGAWIVFLDESGVGFTPPVRRTWAPRGHTPILRHYQRHWTRLSIAGMCCYRPDGTGARLAVHLQPGSYNDQVLIGVLGQLRRFLHGQKVTLLWDGLPSHRSRVMQAFIASQRGWLVVERLPGYAPELKPCRGSVVQPEGPRACQLCR